MKIRLVGTELFHVDRLMDRETDMTKLKGAFCNFSNAPKILTFTEITKRKIENSDLGCTQKLRQSRLLAYRLDNSGYGTY
jgi:hypothetical protein